MDCSCRLLGRSYLDGCWVTRTRRPSHVWPGHSCVSPCSDHPDWNYLRCRWTLFQTEPATRSWYERNEQRTSVHYQSQHSVQPELFQSIVGESHCPLRLKYLRSFGCLNASMCWWNLNICCLDQISNLLLTYLTFYRNPPKLSALYWWESRRRYQKDACRDCWCCRCTSEGSNCKLSVCLFWASWWGQTVARELGISVIAWEGRTRAILDRVSGHSKFIESRFLTLYTVRTKFRNKAERWDMSLSTNMSTAESSLFLSWYARICSIGFEILPCQNCATARAASVHLWTLKPVFLLRNMIYDQLIPFRIAEVGLFQCRNVRICDCLQRLHKWNELFV